MPKGIPGKYFHCKICAPITKFKSISELRKHQWADHRHRYERLMRPRPSESVRDAIRNGNVTSVLKKDRLTLLSELFVEIEKDHQMLGSLLEFITRLKSNLEAHR